MAITVPSRSPRTRAFILAVDRGILAFTRRWLACTNVASGVVAGLPFLAAWLMASEQPALARVIFLIYTPICHQRPERSFFPWGGQMAFCQRDTAIYVTLFLAGLGFALFRHRLRPVRWRTFFALIAPMALDGFTQLFGWRESAWELRVITGALFGIASVWLIYPHLQTGMAEMAAVLEARFQRQARRQPSTREAVLGALAVSQGKGGAS